MFTGPPHGLPSCIPSSFHAQGSAQQSRHTLHTLPNACARQDSPPRLYAQARTGHLAHTSSGADGAAIDGGAEHDVTRADDLHAGLAADEDGGDSRVCQKDADIHGPAREDHRNDGHTCGRSSRDSRDERLLCSGKVNDGAVVALALKVKVGADLEGEEGWGLNGACGIFPPVQII